ncbi:hypothetical protein [Lihuaxuella thermophila]|uniref:Uncharacterized protein n=1 Tax=Lihuaxuella thermophila TaxID=1173111 RepID=A0A1H8ITN5_9BACL|nr:hypothetical protein [Lihuaxuella thermophila]SEN71771.1 hypothetical protein SAMN05444955_11949 [Lihuaxuella thermophila]
MTGIKSEIMSAVDQLNEQDMRFLFALVIGYIDDEKILQAILERAESMER